MQFPAQIQAAIELLDNINDSDLPADILATKYFRSRRYIGSKDRRVISTYVFGCVRHWVQLKWWVQKYDLPDTSRHQVLLYALLVEKLSKDQVRDIYSGKTYQPESFTSIEAAAVEKINDADLIHSDMPPETKLGLDQWSYDILKDVFKDDLDKEIESLNHNAPLDIRVNALKAERADIAKQMRDIGWHVEETPCSPEGLRLDRGTPLSASKFFKQGLVEVQDEASQIAARLCDVQPGHAVLDFCAGAGGKTLALAAHMQNKGRLIATDVLQAKLDKAKDRLRRAGVSNHQLRALDSDGRRWLQRQAGRFDRVLVDAPCSGSGTWRRNPDLRRRYSPEALAELNLKQAEILNKASAMVKTGGHLIYATCSLYPSENEDQVMDFLSRHPGFELIPTATVWQSVFNEPCPASEPMLRLSPYKNQTDGFFVAVLKRT